MSTKFFALLTNIGAARLANATAIGSRLDITHMAVGDGGGVLPTPNPAQTTLINEKRRAAINSLRVDPDNANQIIAEQVIPENEGGFWIRELGLFDAEGNLIAVANCAETYKPQLQEGSGRIQTVRMILIVSSTETVSLKIDPAVVLATRGYVDEAIATHEKSRKHPDATLKEKGLVQLSSATDSASETLAATPKAVKAANDNANGRVPSGRTVNGKALSADIALGAADVGAYTKAETDTKVNAATDAANNAATAAASANDNADSRVPARRKVNGKALNADITLAAGDVGAYSKAETNTELEKKVDTTQLQKSQDDTTAGALVINGGHGLGANARPRAAGATGGAAGCGFFSYQANNADNPFGGTGASGIHVQESTTYGWDLLGRDGGGMDFRLRQINNGVASAWSTLWTSANLVKQSSAFDGTTGSVMLNGAWGWGGNGQAVNYNEATLLAWFRSASTGSRVFRNESGANPYSKRYSPSFIIRSGDTWAAMSIGYAVSGDSGGIVVTSGNVLGTATISQELWTNQNLPNPISASEFAGIPLPFPGAVAPSGFLKCNGQAFDKTTYPILAELYPSGHLPDLRGEFIRGWDDGRKVDTGRALLSSQGDAIRNITATRNGVAEWSDGEDMGAFSTVFKHETQLAKGSGFCQWGSLTFDASKVVPTAAENRPRNIAFNYIVRAA